MKKGIVFGCIALAVVVLVGVLLYFVPYTEKIDFTYQGTIYRMEKQEDPDGKDSAPCTVTFQAEIKHYLFKDTRVSGTLRVKSDLRSYREKFETIVRLEEVSGIDGDVSNMFFVRYIANGINSIGRHTVIVSEDRKSVYIHDEDINACVYDECYYLASELPADQAQEFYDAILAYMNSGK